jgi:murein L,D-transpeptidase YcbB/YkuD
MVVAFVHGEQAARAQLPAPTAEAGKPEVVEASLRRRLVQSGDLRDGEPTASGVKRFQARHGLVADGVVGARTLAALNTPVARQIRQLELNQARSRDDELRRRAPRYVEVNIPAYELRLIEHGEVVLRSRVIVGDADTPTPVFDDQIRYIELNPYWYVPASIVPELVRQAGGDTSFFQRNNYIVRGGPGTGEPLRLVQRPGPGNALGRMKFLFPNHHAVYLHDTSQPRLFGRAERSLSHGCVRVEKPMELAVALLARDGWDEARIQAALARGKTQRIELSEPVPVLLEYRTAFVDDAGVLQFRPDIYGHDAAGIGTFAETGRPMVPRAMPRPEPGPRVAAADEVADSP